MTNYRGRTGPTIGIALTTGPRFKPARDRKVATRGIRCAQCGADVGEPCVSSTDGGPTTPHRTRRVMALRAERETSR